MKLHSLHYSENIGVTGKNPWEISGLIFSRGFNLLVGKNATGKTRVISLINNLARIISDRPLLLDGCWDIDFVSGKAKHIKYKLKILNKSVIEERIYLNNELKVERNSNAKIYSETTKRFISIDPPKDKLVMQIRRDEKEFPYFEEIISWAEHTRGFMFGGIVPSAVEIPSDTSKLLSLNAVPSIIEQMKPETLTKIVNDFNKIGYFVENVSADFAPGLPLAFKMLFMKEKHIRYPLNQREISQGMFRAIALLIIVNHFLNLNSNSTFLVDDLCEGLDYERATKFTKLIYEKVDKENVQFIATTNDSFLMNSVDVERWNILFRDNRKVVAYNYGNSKRILDEFKLTGLSNFDLFSSDFSARLTEKGK